MWWCVYQAVFHLLSILCNKNKISHFALQILFYNPVDIIKGIPVECAYHGFSEFAVAVKNLLSSA
jgi:hypothetical protein